ncbi:serine dehydratase-like isoform 2-T2 [Podargus strigoides]
MPCLVPVISGALRGWGVLCSVIWVMRLKSHIPGPVSLLQAVGQSWGGSRGVPSAPHLSVSWLCHVCVPARVQQLPPWDPQGSTREGNRTNLVGKPSAFRHCQGEILCACGARSQGQTFLLLPPSSSSLAQDRVSPFVQRLCCSCGQGAEDMQPSPRDTRASMAAQPGAGEKPFHIVSPILESLSLSKAAATKVYMKLENVQPTGSFKIRGIGHLCQEVWDEANMRALELAEREGWASIHPFDHPLVWQGHSSLVWELKDSLDTKPDAILLAVGGGGLLAGVVAGLHQVGWQDVPIVAAETWGAHSFHAALTAGRLVSLPDITSVAKCLGAKTVAARALECAQECQVISEVVEDTEAVRAVEQFLDDERMLVQPACGAALALLYTGRLQRLQREGRLRTPLTSVVVVVCGGSSISAAQLRALKSQLGLE